MLFLEQVCGQLMVLGGDLLPVGTVLVTPGVDHLVIEPRRGLMILTVIWRMFHTCNYSLAQTKKV